MRMRVVLLCLLCALLASTVLTRAEVAARVDELGRYQYMIYRYNSSGSAPKIWGGSSATLLRRPLNPDGDLYSDMAPTVVENPCKSNWPLAVWAHPVGGDYDLVYSIWSETGWSPIGLVKADDPYNDLEPRIALNSSGHAYMVWWEDERGQGAVWFSIYMATRWSTPYRVSDPGTDGRHANLTLDSDTQVKVTYETPAGTETKTLWILDPDNITEDIDPRLRKSSSSF